MKTAFTSTLSLAALAAFLSGCASSSETGAYRPQNATKFNQETVEKVVFLDAGAQHAVTCPGLQETTLPDGRLKVVAQMRNRENRRIQVQVNCEFKDSQGFAIDSTPFQTLILTENSIEGVQFASMNDKAKTYTIRVRQAR